MSAGAKHVRRALTAGLLVLAAVLVSAPAASALVDPAAAVNFVGTAGTPFSGPVATFRSTAFDPAVFSVTINWGDGTFSDGTVVDLGFDGQTTEPYRVDGTHTYQAECTCVTTITITEPENQPVIVEGVATVAPVPLPPPPPPPPPPAEPPPPPPPPAPPTILSATFSPPPRVGRATVLRIRSSSPNAPVGGYVVNLGEGGVRFGAEACSLLPPIDADPLNPFLPGTLVTFGLTTTFHRAGRHTITVRVANGECGGDQSTTQTFTINVGARTTRAHPNRGGLVAGAAQTACSDDLTVPDDGNTAVIAAAAVCLVNGERVSAGLAPLAVDARLVTSATTHNTSMIAGRFFAHQGPAEPALGARGAVAGYTAGMGENLGFGVGALSTASAMVDAWMNSPPHRANILDPRFKGVGMSVIASAPTGALTPGVTYTTNFGTDAATGPPPPVATGPATAIRVTMTPSAFRAAASGPSSAPTGPGARVSYTLAGPANVVFTVTRKLAGRRAGKRCVAPRPSNRRKKACVRTRRFGSFRAQGTAGANVVVFRGRVNGRRLAPGRYQLVAVATDESGTASKPQTKSFRILPGRG